ncbi:hypothetical protein FV222_00285 [Methylobacterium sp. WL103]|uniref:hypothetical protein n=1 Tax=Methylobacterium sp. WL103 TaxID=2603891 RepID=UPI0011C81BA4|nr:hypothetical protein [Methylobacterium sp. WL103]TXN08943.1 hypothetical protein FV222_00285 [Methylobacterium sp. WL103]
MDITVNASKNVIPVGMSFFEVFLGADTYASTRTGDAVKVTTADGDVDATVQSVQIGPLGQFLGQGVPHVSNLGRAHDVRSMCDAIEKRYPASKKANKEALDPRTLYTAVIVAIPAPTPVAAIGAPPIAV